jgi:hypothetical protein
MIIRDVRLSPGKGRWPKKAKKREMRRYLLKAGTAYKKAKDRERGFLASSGGASSVRQIDPQEYMAGLEREQKSPTQNAVGEMDGKK